MPGEPGPPSLPLAEARPISSEGGWTQLMRTLSRTVPARLYRTRKASGGLRALRRR